MAECWKVGFVAWLPVVIEWFELAAWLEWVAWTAWVD